MASIIANGPGVPAVRRGSGQNIGTLPTNAATTVVQFTVTGPANTPNGFDSLIIFTAGGTVTAASQVLECSIDGGNTWATVVQPTSASSATTFTASAFGGDTAVSSATGYTIAGLQALAIFRFGAAVTAGSAVVWVACAG